MNRILLCSFALLTATLANAQATTRYVAATGSDSNAGTLSQPFRTIARGIAISATDGGDVVAVANGTYNEHDLDFGGKNLTLMSQSGNPAGCILDCQGLGQGVNISGGQTAAMVAGLTIRNGNASASIYTGGAMTISRSAATVSNCVFSACRYSLQSNLGASAVYVYYATGATFTGCTFSGNGSSNINDRGAIVVDTTSSLTLSGCAFTGNSKGALRMYNTTVNLTDCTFTNNLSTEGGAAIFHAGYGLTANRCVFTGNHSNNDPYSSGGGGAMWIYHGLVTLTNCLITANTSNSGPATITSQIVVGPISSSLTLLNCTVIAVSPEDFNENILVSCPRFSDGTKNVTAVNSIVRGASGLDDIYFANTSNGTVTFSNVGTDPDPKFVNPAAGNYRLQSTSPCINAGSSSAQGLPSTDLDGGPRILGTAPDMGAYELWTSTSGSWFVDAATGNDTNAGSPTAPFKTAVKAINSANAGQKIYIKQSAYSTDKPRITKKLQLFNWQDTGAARVGKS